MFHKSRIYPLALILIVFIVWKFRESRNSEWISLNGQTMGTTYSIKYQAPNGENYKDQIDSILLNFNDCLSTYIVNSEISRFNQDSILYFELPYFYPVLQKSQEIYNSTGGAFDPTVMPLVNAWGFGPDSGMLPDSSKVDSLKQFVGYDNIQFNEEKVWKSKNGIELDFSAIAKGYGVDIVAEFLSNQGLDNYFVEIGGEVMAYGLNDKDLFWRLGIEDPSLSLGQRTPKAIVELENMGMATSGNYRNYYLKDGVKYAHTINPHTGYPVEHSLLSATVFAKDCMTADAYATSFMVMGLEEAKMVLSAVDGLEAFMIFSNEEGALQTFSTQGVDKITIIDN
jgi:thiamine biosynthesis lipoprotein